MVVKTFTAPTMQEALLMARDALGEDAVVLNARQVRTGGLLGLFRGPNIELMAAIDRSDKDRAVTSKNVGWDGCESEKPRGEPVTRFAASNRSVRTDSQPMPMAPSSFVAKAYADAAICERENDLARLRDDIRELRAMVTALANQAPPSVQDKPPLLLKLGVDSNIARSELSDLLDLDDPQLLASRLAEKLRPHALPPVVDVPSSNHNSGLQVSERSAVQEHRARVIALVGPTGVGKTTTLAKLAARFALQQGLNVGLVTMDTYRIGAVDQIRTYATIMNLPLEIAMTPEEVSAAVKKHEDKNIILIDTVGRSPRSPDHIDEVRQFLAEAGEIETHLVIAASSSREVQRETLDRFSVLAPARLIITKIDESANRGCIVNLPYWAGIGISSVTAGQNVPQDIEFANADKLARLVTEVA